MILRKKIFWLHFLTLILIAMNLRAPITTIGPLVENIQEYFGLNAAFTGFLTSLPLLAFGIFSFIAAKFQPTKTMFIGLLCIFFGEIIRGYTGFFATIFHIHEVQKAGIYGLFLGTTIMGAGIAVANVLLPSYVKSKFPHNIARYMGIYSFVLNTSAIVGIALALPLMRTIGLLHTMVFWALFAFLALLIYIPQIRNGRLHRIQHHQQTTTHLLRNCSAWKVTLFLGIQSFMFYGIIVWLPKIIVEKGYNIDEATHITLLTQLIAIPVALFGPIILTHLRNAYKPFYMAGLCGFYVIGLGMLLLYRDFSLMQHDFWLYAIAVILGIPMGGVFSIALLFISHKSSNVFISIKLSAMSQGFGYLIASVSPFLMGLLHDIFQSFQQGIFVFIIFGIMLCVLGLLAYKAEKITGL